MRPEPKMREGQELGRTGKWNCSKVMVPQGKAKKRFATSTYCVKTPSQCVMGGLG